MSTSEPPTPVDGMPLYVEPRRRGPGTGTIVMTLLAAALAGVVVGGLLVFGGGDDDEPDGDGTTSGTDVTVAPIAPVSVASFDPVGGSGFRDEGDGTWETQTYTTAEFGALKPGVGLLLDLGEPREVSTVTFEGSPGLAVELLAGDAPPSGDVSGMTSASSTTTVDGATQLSGADAGAHQYWMVWVTQLAPSDGGFSATISTPTVEGPAA